MSSGDFLEMQSAGAELRRARAIRVDVQAICYEVPYGLTTNKSPKPTIINATKAYIR